MTIAWRGSDWRTLPRGDCLPPLRSGNMRSSVSAPPPTACLQLRELRTPNAYPGCLKLGCCGVDGAGLEIIPAASAGGGLSGVRGGPDGRSEEHTSELQ